MRISHIRSFVTYFTLAALAGCGGATTQSSLVPTAPGQRDAQQLARGAAQAP